MKSRFSIFNSEPGPVSHSAEFTTAECIGLFASPVLTAVFFAGIMHLGAHFRWFPPPRPTLDADRTIIVHKAEASLTTNDAEILLLGDSSCLMDVSAVQLSRRLGYPVFNLGTLSYLDLSANALLLRNYAKANPDQLRAVVLLMHPDALRLPHVGAWQNDALRSFLEVRDFYSREPAHATFARLFGVEIFIGRLLARMLPRPLPGSFGHYYGFTDNLEEYLDRNRGSAVDPASRPAAGNAEYWLADYYRTASKSFQKAVPSGVPLFAVITPLPVSFAGPEYSRRHSELLEQWSNWLGAAAVLTNVPAALPDDLFAQKTHLNESGQIRYTDDLAQALGSLLRR